jgi:hypothetical protein
MRITDLIANTTIPEGFINDISKILLPKAWVHKFKRAVHAKKYQQALKLYHQMILHYNRNPEAQSMAGVFVANPKGLALSKAAQMVGISTKELKKVLDRDTRYT